MTSPGCSVVNVEMNSMIVGTSKIIDAVVLDCLTTPFTVSSIASAPGSGISSAVTRSGPKGPEPSKFLPAPNWIGGFLICQSRMRDVVEDRVAGDVVERVGLGDVPPAAADDHRELRLPVDRLGDPRHLDRLAVGDERLREADEEVGLGEDVELRLRGVLGVVARDADDLRRARDDRQQLEVGGRVVLGLAGALLERGAGGRHRGVAALEQGDDVGGTFGSTACEVDDGVVGAGAEPCLAAAAVGDESHGSLRVSR